MKKKTILIIWSPNAFHRGDIEDLVTALNVPRRGFDAISLMSEDAKEDIRFIDLGKLTNAEIREVRGLIGAARKKSQGDSK